MEILQGVWKQHLRPRAVVGYGVKIFLPSPPNYVTRSPGKNQISITVKIGMIQVTKLALNYCKELSRQVSCSFGSVSSQSSSMQTRN